MALACLLGIHRPVWVPIDIPDATDPDTWGGWIKVRRCRHCGRNLGRTHLE